MSRSSACFVLVATVLVPGRGLAADTPLAAAARQRQAACKTVEFVFRQKEVIRPGAVTDAASHSPALARVVQKSVPEAETTVESVNRLVLDGDRGRLEDNHPVFNAQTGVLNAKKQGVSTTDGRHAKNFLNFDAERNNDLMGTIERTGVQKRLITPGSAAILLCCRGVDPSVSPYPLSDFPPAVGRLPLAGVPCDLYTLKLGASTVEVWADPAADHVIKRMRVSAGATVDGQYDVRYAQQPTGVWLPREWTYTKFTRSGQIGSTLTATCDAAIKSAGDYAADTFDVVFPPKTRVYDDRDQKKYRVTDGGDLQPESASGEPAGPARPQDERGWRTRNVWLAGLVAVGLVGGVWAVARRLRPRRAGRG